MPSLSSARGTEAAPATKCTAPSMTERRQGARNEYETRRPSSVPCTTACGRWSQSLQDIRSVPPAAPDPETVTVAWISPVVRSHSACPLDARRRPPTGRRASGRRRRCSPRVWKRPAAETDALGPSSSPTSAPRRPRPCRPRPRRPAAGASPMPEVGGVLGEPVHQPHRAVLRGARGIARRQRLDEPADDQRRAPVEVSQRRHVRRVRHGHERRVRERGRGGRAPSGEVSESRSPDSTSTGTSGYWAFGGTGGSTRLGRGHRRQESQ